MTEKPAFLVEIDILIRARYPLIYLVTFEEQRVESMLGEVARAHGKVLLEWTVTRGLSALSGAHRGTPIKLTHEPVAALQHIGKLRTPRWCC